MSYICIDFREGAEPHHLEKIPSSTGEFNCENLCSHKSGFDLTWHSQWLEAQCANHRRASQRGGWKGYSPPPLKKKEFKNGQFTGNENFQEMRQWNCTHSVTSKNCNCKNSIFRSFLIVRSNVCICRRMDCNCMI